MNDKADFVLSAAGESDDLTTPREAWAIGRLKDDVRDDYMIVRVMPPIIGQKYGLGDKDIQHLLLASRLQGETLFPVSSWPHHVYVFRIVNDTILERGVFGPVDVEMITWGFLQRPIGHTQRSN